jgi:hypothetical protein
MPSIPVMGYYSATRLPQKNGFDRWQMVTYNFSQGSLLDFTSRACSGNQSENCQTAHNCIWSASGERIMMPATRNPAGDPDSLSSVEGSAEASADPSEPPSAFLPQFFSYQ